MQPSNSWILPAALLALLGALALWAWLRAVRWFYRVRSPRPEVLRVRCEDGWELAVHHRPAPKRRFLEPVLLCHGLAANHYNFDFDPPYSLAHYLAEAGFECFTVEWRGTGGSQRPPAGRRWSYSADDHILLDGPAVLRAALQRSGAGQAFWLGHSLGGLIGYAVAEGPEQARLRGLIAFGAPVFFRYSRLLQRIARWGALASWPFGLRYRWWTLGLAPFLGYLPLPLSDIVVNPKHIAPRLQRQLTAHLLTSISRRLLVQFRDWIVHDAFRSVDGKVDYRAGLPRLRLPVLVAGGSQDRLAPPANLEAQYAQVGSQDKTLMVFGRDRGDKEEYGHGDLIFGTGAPTEVYPRLMEWLSARATKVEGAGETSAEG